MKTNKINHRPIYLHLSIETDRKMGKLHKNLYQGKGTTEERVSFLLYKFALSDS